MAKDRREARRGERSHLLVDAFLTRLDSGPHLCVHGLEGLGGEVLCEESRDA